MHKLETVRWTRQVLVTKLCLVTLFFEALLRVSGVEAPRSRASRRGVTKQSLVTRGRRLLVFASCILCASHFAVVAFAADVESRQLTHYVPQDFLETVVRTEGWTE